MSAKSDFMTAFISGDFKKSFNTAYRRGYKDAETDVRLIIVEAIKEEIGRRGDVSVTSVIALIERGTNE